MNAQTQQVPPEEFQIALDNLHLAHELLLGRPCKNNENMSVHQCRGKKKADCSMCESALMNEEYFVDLDQRLAASK